MAAENTCFVIMPITVSPGMEDKYGDGPAHFDHVYDCLFKPSVEAAGYIPISPKATGSQNIQAGIIKNLDTADLVLCDMSSLNPNVFFEWGIRTSLNKPVCVVKDDLTKDVPFDVGTLQWEEYSSGLEAWEIKKECEKLTKHLQATVEKSGGGNELWKHFGLKEAAEAFKPEKGENTQLAYLAMQMETLQQKVDSIAGEQKAQTEQAWAWNPARQMASGKGGGQTREDLNVAGAVLLVHDFFGKKKGWQLVGVGQSGPAEIRVVFRMRGGKRDRAWEEKVGKAVWRDFGIGVECECLN